MFDFSAEVQDQVNPFEPLTDLLTRLATHHPAALADGLAVLRDEAARADESFTGHRADHARADDYEAFVVAVESLITDVAR